MRSLAWEALLPAETTSVAETIRLGRQLGEALQPGDIVALYGDLGAGKTHLVKGVCTVFGIEPGRVTSPTFTLVNEYTEGPFPVYHIDAYRIRHLEEMIELGFDAYIAGDALCLIEWPERIEPLLPDDVVRLHLSHSGQDHRRIAPHEPVHP